MKSSDIDYSTGAFSNEAKAVSGFALVANAVLEYLANFAIRIQNGQEKMEDQLNRERRGNGQRHQKTVQRKPLERLIRTGYYPF